jgi:hypothetical protein
LDSLHGIDCIGRHVIGHADGSELDESMQGGFGCIIELAVDGATETTDSLELDLQ